MRYNLTETSPPLEQWIDTDHYYVVLGNYTGGTTFSSIEQVAGETLVTQGLDNILPATMDTPYAVWDINDNIARVACNVTNCRVEQLGAELTVLRVPHEIQVGQTFTVNGTVYTRDGINTWASEQVP